MPAEDVLNARLQAFVAGSPGVAVQTEMAGDWNSLGIVFSVPEPLAGAARVEFGNAVIALMREFERDCKPGFTWSIGIYCGEELLFPLGPSSGPARLCPMCGKAQETWLGETCLACRTQLPP